MAVPSALVLKCASCGEEGPHRVLQGRVGGRRGRTFHGTVKCTHCGTVSSATYREPRTVSVDLLVSWMDKTEHHTLDLDETRAVAVGEQFPAEGGTVEVTNADVIEFQKGIGVDLGTMLDIFSEPGHDHARAASDVEHYLTSLDPRKIGELGGKQH